MMIGTLSLSNQPSSRATRRVATATIQASEIGMRYFQPSFMNWS